MEKGEVQDRIDSNSEIDILTAEEVAQYLKKSLSWVYKHWQILGGVKARGFHPVSLKGGTS